MVVAFEKLLSLRALLLLHVPGITQREEHSIGAVQVTGSKWRLRCVRTSQKTGGA